MKDKEYGVKLTADIDKFKKKMLEAKDVTNSVTQAIKDRVKNPMEEASSSGKRSFDDRISKIAELSGKYGELLMQYLNVVSVEGRYSESANKLKQELKDLTKEVEKEGEELGEVAEAMEDLGDGTEDTNKKSHNFIGIFQNFDGSIKKALFNIKRFSLSLLGIQSLYSALSKATNAYMSTDETLHNKLQASWIALGATMAPIIEKLIALFQRFVGYVNVFYKAFTGKDLISKALKNVEKQTNKNTKAQKELNKELSKFDEITNLSFDTGTNDIDNNTGIPSIADELKNMQAMEINPTFASSIEHIVEKLKEIWGWIKSLTDLWEGFRLKIEGIRKVFEGLWHFVHGIFTGNKEEAKEGIKTLFEGIQLEIEGNKKIFTTIKDLLVQAFKTALRTIFDLVKEWLEEKITDFFKKKFKIIGEKVGEIMGMSIKDIINAILTRVESKINGFFKNINDAIDIINNIPGVEIKHIKLAKLPRLAKGNVAYKPTVAEFGEYSGANTNPEITAPQNMMRQTLFEALEQALPLVNASGNQEHGDIILNVNGKEFARATYSDYQSEARRMGSSSVAIRRS